MAYYSKSRCFCKSSKWKVTRFPEQRVKAAKPISEGTPRGRMREADKTEMQRAETPSRNLPDEKHTESMHGATVRSNKQACNLRLDMRRCEWDSAGGIFFRLVYSVLDGRSFYIARPTCVKERTNKSPIRRKRRSVNVQQHLDDPPTPWEL